jgi:hypothetical protein
MKPFRTGAERARAFPAAVATHPITRAITRIPDTSSAHHLSPRRPRVFYCTKASNEHLH